MNDLEDINKLKDDNKKTELLNNYYKEKIKINDWLNNNYKISIINFKDRTEYKMYNKYHRINGPAIDYKDEELNQYYYKGILYENYEEWEKKTIKDIRRIKIKKLNSSE